MPETVLVIGDKRKSSWSLRAWLFLRHHGVAFREVAIRLDQPDTRDEILKHSPSGKVPCLVHGNIRVWESIAICETAADLFKLRDPWPVAPEARAFARSVAAEMHASFAALRAHFPFDATRIPQTLAPSSEAAEDIRRIAAIWREARSKYADDGEWLFGKFGIADAMFAPVAVRFHKYGVPLEGAERDYLKTLLSMPALREWMGAALMEAEMEEAEAAGTQAAGASPAPQAPEPESPPNVAQPRNRPVPKAEVDDLDETELMPVGGRHRAAEPRRAETPLAPGQIRSKIIPP